jgi:hypothetical protein
MRSVAIQMIPQSSFIKKSVPVQGAVGKKRTVEGYAIIIQQYVQKCTASTLQSVHANDIGRNQDTSILLFLGKWHRASRGI